MSDIGDIACKFEDLIQNSEIEFNEVPIEAVQDVFVKLVITSFLVEHKLLWKFGNKKVGNAVCVKIEDKLLQFLDIYPDTQQFQWCTDNHRIGVQPDQALVHLMKMDYPNLDIKARADGSIEVGGVVVYPGVMKT